MAGCEVVGRGVKMLSVWGLAPSLMATVALVAVAGAQLALGFESGAPPPRVANVRGGALAAHRTGRSISVRGSASPCSAVARCLATPSCNTCLVALNVTTRIGSLDDWHHVSSQEQREVGLAFFDALTRTKACAYGNASLMLLEAVVDLSENSQSACVRPYRMFVPDCEIMLVACAQEPNCALCMAGIRAAMNESSGKTRAISSEACKRAYFVPHGPYGGLYDSCQFFPTCSYAKFFCTSEPACARCLQTLNNGNGTAAALDCQNEDSVYRLNLVLSSCTQDSSLPGPCSFWRQRCRDSAGCMACLADIGGGADNVASLSQAFAASPACRFAMNSSQGPWFISLVYLSKLLASCSSIGSPCRTTVAACVAKRGMDCIMCINGSYAPGTPAYTQVCEGSGMNGSNGVFFNTLVTSINNAQTFCRPCPTAAGDINTIVLATATVGAASVVACLAVILTIFANGRDRVSMRDRIVIGLLFANAVYSSANAIPLGMVGTTGVDCGELLLSFSTIRFGRALWFAGKWSMVASELLIVGASMHALTHAAAAMTFKMEAALHSGCAVVGLSAFAVFYIVCRRIEDSDGYNGDVEAMALSGSIDHLSADDDLDDNYAITDAANEYRSGRREYVALVQDMLIAWDVVVGIAVASWLAARVLYARVVRRLQDAARSAEQSRIDDEWTLVTARAWEDRKRFVEAQQRAFKEVAGPLEPYIFMFVAFGIPAFAMSVPWCATRSAAEVVQQARREAATWSVGLAYGTCDVWCEFALAFRSLATVAVYLWPRDRRVEFLAVCATARKLLARISWAARGRHLAGWPLASSRFNNYEMVPITPTGVHVQSSRQSLGGPGVETVPIDASRWKIDESSLDKDRLLGAGAYGEVWAATWTRGRDRLPVAVKHMLGGERDSDGDFIDINASTDFSREISSLISVDNHHLTKVYGFGVSKDGIGFIVTELVDGGALDAVLLDERRELSWQKRYSIALQIAFGMEHLHGRGLLHRDLKSKNVVVDSTVAIAKVCDFGLSRLAPPPRQLVLYSPFTGSFEVIRAEPAVGSKGAGFLRHSTDVSRGSLSDCLVSYQSRDASGTNMTRAVGTLQWMAPEVFCPGVVCYGTAADVYSFSVVLWELAARKVPWQDELGSYGCILDHAVSVTSALKSGQRPTMPGAVSARRRRYVRLVRLCWASDPTKRPSMSEAAAQLAACLRAEVAEARDVCRED